MERNSILVPYNLDEIQSPVRLSILLDLIPVGYYNPDNDYSWNPDDCSPNMFVKADDSFTCHRNPSPDTTDAIRGKTAFTKGIHVWEIFWPINKRGTHASVGVATGKQALECNKYKNLIGNSVESWGWDLVSNNLHHGDIALGKYPAMLDSNEKLRAPEQILIILDMEEGTLSYSVETAYLGVAFRGLQGLSLYPAISSVSGHAEITLKYIGSADCSPFSLEIICRHTFHNKISKNLDKNQQLSLNVRELLKHNDSWYQWVTIKRHPEYLD